MTLPWGLALSANPEDAIGRAILRSGVFDLSVTEVIWRLVNLRDHAVDVGANIGYLTSLMARRCGKEGTVLGIEAHPDVFADLEENVNGWAVDSDLGQIRLMACALGSNNCDGSLLEPAGFPENHGLARLATAGDSDNAQGVVSHAVKIRTLDSVCAEGKIGLLKIDVEGGEYDVLLGATGLLGRKGIRDIVFEEFAAPPSPTMTYLVDRGYSMFAIGRSFLGPSLVAPGTALNRLAWESPSYLATIQPDRALARMGARGWRCLGRG